MKRLFVLLVSVLITTSPAYALDTDHYFRHRFQSIQENYFNQTESKGFAHHSLAINADLPDEAGIKVYRFDYSFSYSRWHFYSHINHADWLDLMKRNEFGQSIGYRLNRFWMAGSKIRYGSLQLNESTLSAVTTSHSTNGGLFTGLSFAVGPKWRLGLFSEIQKNLSAQTVSFGRPTGLIFVFYSKLSYLNKHKFEAWTTNHGGVFRPGLGYGYSIDRSLDFFSRWDGYLKAVQAGVTFRFGRFAIQGGRTEFQTNGRSSVQLALNQKPASPVARGELAHEKLPKAKSVVIKSSSPKRKPFNPYGWLSLYTLLRWDIPPHISVQMIKLKNDPKQFEDYLLRLDPKISERFAVKLQDTRKRK